MTALATGEWINLSIAIATVVMAVGTFYLAIVTQKLAKGAADGIQQAERHHQENLRPSTLLMRTICTRLALISIRKLRGTPFRFAARFKTRRRPRQGCFRLSQCTPW